jgi:hypothetical protein
MANDAGYLWRLSRSRLKDLGPLLCCDIRFVVDVVIAVIT